MQWQQAPISIQMPVWGTNRGKRLLMKRVDSASLCLLFTVRGDMSDTSRLTIVRFSVDDLYAHETELGQLIHDCVHAGASIGYVLPYELADGIAFWSGKIANSMNGGKLVLLVAFLDGAIVGTAQLDYDTNPNQPHRAEVRKLMVHPDYRREGIGRALMSAIEIEARKLDRSLLTLDTRSGDSAEPLYVSLGYQVSGVIPGYCIDAHSGELDSTTIMYKQLEMEKAGSGL